MTGHSKPEETLYRRPPLGKMPWLVSENRLWRLSWDKSLVGCAARSWRCRKGGVAWSFARASRAGQRKPPAPPPPVAARHRPPAAAGSRWRARPSHPRRRDPVAPSPASAVTCVTGMPPNLPPPWCWNWRTEPRFPRPSCCCHQFQCSVCIPLTPSLRTFRLPPSVSCTASGPVKRTRINLVPVLPGALASGERAVVCFPVSFQRMQFRRFSHVEADRGSRGYRSGPWRCRCGSDVDRYRGLLWHGQDGCWHDKLLHLVGLLWFPEGHQDRRVLRRLRRLLCRL